MWRYLAGGVAALLMVAAGVLLSNALARRDPPAPIQPLGSAPAAAPTDPLPDALPEASARTREQKRFDRYDKDRNDSVTREEYLAARRKAFAKLDTNHDGALSFDEWAIKATTKFAGADKDRSNTLSRAELATTAVKRKAPRRPVNCPPAQAAPAGDDS